MGRQLKLAQVESEILQYSSSANFPQPTGSIKYLYLDQSANTLYRWDALSGLNGEYVLLNSATTPPTSGSAEGELYFADLVTSARLMPCTYNNGISGSGATLISTGSIALGQFNQPGKIDNTTPLADDIILVRSETAALRNGLYSITDLGSPTSSFVLTRVSYYDTGSEIYPSQITGLRGTTGANQTYIQQTPNPIVGSSSIIFSQSPSTSTQTLPILFIDTVTTAPLPLSTYATGSTYVGFPGAGATLTATASGALGVIGGVTASSGVRLLAVSESNPVRNGSYTVTAPGSATTPWKLTRIDYWTSMQPNIKEFVVSRFGATEYGSRYVLQSSSITPANIGISQSLIFQKYLYQASGSGGSSTPTFPFTGSAIITGSLTITGSIIATTGFTGSLQGTASFAQTASYVSQSVSSSFATTASYYNEIDPIFVAKSGSFATTGSNIFKGNQTISGSIYLNSGSVINSTGADIIIKAGVGNNAGVALYNNSFTQYLAVDDTGSYTNKFTVADKLTIAGSNGKLIYTGTTSGVYPINTLAEVHTNDDNPWLEKFYNDTFSTSTASMAYFGWNDGRFVFHNESTQSIGLQVNGFGAENGLLVYSDKVAFVNNVEVTGSLNVVGGITGSLFGTSSWATNAITASYITSSNVYGPFGANSILSASYATTASYSKNLQISGSINNVDYIDFNTSSVVTQPVPGRLSWNDTDGTLDIGLKGGNVTLQIGQEEVARVVNKTGANLLESQYRAVRVRSVAEGGAQGQRLAVVLAQADNDANSATTIGVVTEDINVNQDGFITLSGQVRGINTTGTLQGETWTDGDVLYLSPSTPGYLTNVKPQAPQHAVIVGYVEYAHNNQGKIFVKIDNGYEIDELHNVRINTGSLASGQLLIRSGSLWTNSNQLTGSYGLTGSLTATSFTGSLRGTASFATSASWAPDTTFPYTGSAIVTGSIILTGSLQVAVPSTAGAASELARFKPTDNTGFLQIINYSTTTGAFTPTIRTFLSASATNTGLQLIAQIGNDGATNTNPAMTFLVMSQSAAVGQIRNRTLFTWENNSTSSMALTNVGLAIGTNLLTPSASLHINNTSSFNSFLVEDDTRPDASPFVIDNVGRVGIGKLSPSASLDITGSVLVTGSVSITQNVSASRASISSSNGTVSGSSLTVYGSGSALPVFTVQGSQGELFSINDSLSGSLFSVNDISGLPILEVFSDNTTLMGNYQDPMLITTAKTVQTNSGSFVVYSLPTASYDTAFFEYSVRSGSNARAGTIMAIQSGSAVNFTETTTTDFGSTSAVSFTVIVTGSNMALTGSSTLGAWTTKCIVRGL